jgi:hypothetical protein
MKRLSYFLLTVFIFIGYACNKDSDDLIENEYSRASDYRIKRMVHYSSSNSTKESRGIEYSYDDSGNLIKESYYDYYPQKILWTYKEYDYSGNKKIRQNVYDGAVTNLTLGLYYIYHYTNDNLTKEELFRGYDNSFAYAMNYEYDNHNNLIRRYMDDADYGITGDVRYVYNDKNQLTLEENTAFDLTDYKYIKYIYDEKDREIKLEYYNIEWQLLYYVSKVYENDSSNPSGEIRFDNNNTQLNKYNHYYDKWNNLVQTVINDDCSLFRRKYKGELLIEAINYDLVWGCVEVGMTRYEYEKIRN